MQHSTQVLGILHLPPHQESQLSDPHRQTQLSPGKRAAQLVLGPESRQKCHLQMWAGLLAAVLCFCYASSKSVSRTLDTLPPRSIDGTQRLQPGEEGGRLTARSGVTFRFKTCGRCTRTTDPRLRGSFCI
ncbi:unnamed protein product [Lepidochelys olivacea]